MMFSPMCAFSHLFTPCAHLETIATEDRNMLIVLLQLASRQNERLSDSFDAVHISSEDLPHFYFPVLC